MKISKLGCLAVLFAGTGAGAHEGQLPAYAAGAPDASAQAGYCDCGQSVCGCEPLVGPEYGAGPVAYDSGCDAPGGALGLGGGLGSRLSGLNLSQLGCGDLEEPWTLFGEHGGWSAGGWVQTGYHTAAMANFNSRPDEVQLHQAWLYAQKAIDTSNGFDIGGRIDYVYGTDAQDTQAFGTSPRGWDNDWDHGNDYGHAMPQLYLEAGYGDLSVKVGHFFTIIGWEVVAAPDNFFYSHAYTMIHSEPFTHTGALATYNVSEDVSVSGGYVAGWDSGFDDNGDAFLGSVSLQLTDDWNVTYATVGGVFANGNYGPRETGYMHSIVTQYALTERLQYITQGDVLQSEGADGGTYRDTYGTNQYLIYSLSDRLALGSRFEWWSVAQDSVGLGGVTGAGSRVDIYDLTAGLNYRPHANVVVRPEVRYDWARGASSAELSNLNAGNGLFESGRDQFTFGIDSIFTF